jgi:putative endonuclease
MRHPIAQMERANVREKRIKRWPRAWKYELIHKNNPTWRDLAEDFGFEPLRKQVKADPGSSPG